MDNFELNIALVAPPILNAQPEGIPDGALQEALKTYRAIRSLPGLNRDGLHVQAFSVTPGLYGHVLNAFTLRHGQIAATARQQIWENEQQAFFCLSASEIAEFLPSYAEALKHRRVDLVERLNAVAEELSVIEPLARRFNEDDVFSV